MAHDASKRVKVLVKEKLIFLAHTFVVARKECGVVEELRHNFIHDFLELVVVVVIDNDMRPSDVKLLFVGNK